MIMLSGIIGIELKNSTKTRAVEIANINAKFLLVATLRHSDEGKLLAVTGNCYLERIDTDRGPAFYFSRPGKKDNVST